MTQTDIKYTGASALSGVTMTETGANTGVFESFDATGAAQFLTIESKLALTQ